MAHWIIEDHGFGGQYYKCSANNELRRIDISWTEFVSSFCKECAFNTTELRAFNPICVHCSHVTFVKQDLFTRKDTSTTANDMINERSK